MTRRATLSSVLLAASLTSSGSVRAQQHAHGATAGHLGTVHFPTSCRGGTTPRFDHAVALLHSFEFGAAIRGFQSVLAADSSCAIAWWGIALSRWGNPMSAGNRAPTLLAEGQAAAAAGQRMAAGSSPRERAYVEAVSVLYDDYEHRDQRARVTAYEQATARVAAAFPADTEAAIFHAIAQVAAASPGDKSYASQRAAGATLEALWRAQPNHPGLAHYIIHSYDYPALAPRATRAAERYAVIAPAAAHALHMPSHTFTRLGQWQASIDANRRSMQAALRDSSLAEVLHAGDYLAYAYLQLGREADARDLLARLPVLAARFDPDVAAGAAPASAGVFALAAIPARYALERRAWSEAAALTPAHTAFPWTEAMTWFARGLGAAHLSRIPDARAAADSLGDIRDRLGARNEPYWAEQVAIQQLGAQAWLARAEGDSEGALARMREAASREDATEKSAVTPGPLAPARELLGDLLLELGRPAEALVEYRAVLAKEPGRRHSIGGEAAAARQARDDTVTYRRRPPVERDTARAQPFAGIADTEEMIWPDSLERTRVRLGSARYNLLNFETDKGRLPTSLSELFPGPIESYVMDFRHDAWGREFRYTIDGGDFELRSAGHDGHFGTADDIVATRQFNPY